MPNIHTPFKPVLHLFGIGNLIMLLIMSFIIILAGFILFAEGTYPVLTYFMPFSGVAIIMYAVIKFIQSRKRLVEIQRLKKIGHKTQGLAIDIRRGYQYRRRVVVTAPDMDGIMQSYISDPLFGIQRFSTDDLKARSLTYDVYLDPANSRHYYVDVAALPELK